VRVVGDSDVLSAALGSDGRHFFSLTPGAWEVLISSIDFGMQSHQLDVPAGATALHRVDARLRVLGGDGALEVIVTDPAQAPVHDAEILLNDALLGKTGVDGALRVGGLAPGPGTLQVNATGMQPISQDVDVQEAVALLQMTPPWAPGAMKLTVTSAQGPVTDAAIRVTGPETFMVSPDEQGQRTLQLSPGSWHVLVSSLSQGFLEHSLELKEGDPTPRRLTLRMAPPDVGESVLKVSARDEDYRPVPNVDVQIDGEYVGTTSAGGDLIATGLLEGPITATLIPPAPMLTSVVELQIAPGSQERFVKLKWPRTTVTVTAVDPDGDPVDATVYFEGKDSVPQQRLGLAGVGSFEVGPGSWSLLASSDGYGVQRVPFEIKPGGVSRDIQIRFRPAQVALGEDSIQLFDHVLFGLDSADLRSEGQELIEEVANMIISRPDIVLIEVQGHTDDTGGFNYNMELGAQRAASVLRALIDLGVPPERVTAKGYGMLRPLVENTSEEGRARNRRVQFQILEMTGE